MAGKCARFFWLHLSDSGPGLVLLMRIANGYQYLRNVEQCPRVSIERIERSIEDSRGATSVEDFDQLVARGLICAPAGPIRQLGLVNGGKISSRKQCQRLMAIGQPPSRKPGFSAIDAVEELRFEFGTRWKRRFGHGGTDQIVRITKM